MRLLVVSDLHYSLRQLDWTAARAGDFDAVVIAGDLLDIGSSVPLESQIVVVRKYLERLAAATTLLVCSGNHDLTARNHHGEKSAPWLERATDVGAHVDWGRLDTGNVRITICPWWDGPATRADVERQLAADAEDRPERWVWMYHYPPDGSPVSWTGHRYIGDQDLNRWIERFEPDLVLAGHIHESPFREGGSWVAQLGETWVINVGHAPGPVPTHAVIDLDAGTADWWSYDREDTAQLWSAA